MKRRTNNISKICMAVSLAIIAGMIVIARIADNQMFDGSAPVRSYAAPTEFQMPQTVPAESTASEFVGSPLYAKKIIYDGDSICESRLNNGGGYAKLIADQTGCTYDNFAKGGACLTTREDGAEYHSVVENLVNLPTDGDLYCFEGGINDLWGRKKLGTFDPEDMTGELDESTVCGALESIFRYAKQNFEGKPVCFVITHPMKDSDFQKYRDAMVGICQKYDVPYYDAFTESGLDGHNTEQSEQYLTGNSKGVADGCHPNEAGYLRFYVPQLTALFEQII